MSRLSIEAKRKDMFMIEPELLTLVYDKNNSLYDPRVEDDFSESMVANIAYHGVLEPVIVRKNGDNIEVVAGRRRTKAAIEANKRLKTEGKMPILMPCIIKNGNDADLFGILVSENEIRREDNVMIKGMKARKLLNLGYDVQQISIVFGVSRQTVDNWLAADELPTQIKNDIESGNISATAAIQLVNNSKTRDEQVDEYKKIKDSGVKLTVSNLSSKPKMKSRKEIEFELFHNCEFENKEYEAGYRDALQMVLGNK